MGGLAGALPMGAPAGDVPMGAPVGGVPVGAPAGGVPMGAPAAAAGAAGAPSLSQMVERFRAELGVGGSSIGDAVDGAVAAIGGAALQAETAAMGYIQKAERCYKVLGWSS
eukprot:4212696-Prymnesium_polylepis.1